MTVTQIEAMFGSKSKYRVYLDGQPAFVLYKGELSHYHIREGYPLGEKEYGDIRDMLIKRARMRAMKLLEMSDRSEEALRKKLEKFSGRQVKLSQRLDPGVLGGLRVEMEGKSLDGTVKGRLQGIAEKLNEMT